MYQTTSYKSLNVMQHNGAIYYNAIVMDIREVTFYYTFNCLPLIAIQQWHSQKAPWEFYHISINKCTCLNKRALIL